MAVKQSAPALCHRINEQGLLMFVNRNKWNTTLNIYRSGLKIHASFVRIPALKGVSACRGQAETERDEGRRKKPKISNTIGIYAEVQAQPSVLNPALVGFKAGPTEATAVRNPNLPGESMSDKMFAPDCPVKMTLNNVVALMPALSPRENRISFMGFQVFFDLSFINC